MEPRADAGAAGGGLRGGVYSLGRGLGLAAQDIFSRAQAALESAGLRREPHWTPREYAAWVSLRRPDLSGITRLAEEHYLERYAGLPRTSEEIAAARKILKELLRNRKKTDSRA